MDILTYLAGIVDGEGCIHIVKVKPSGNNISTRYILKVTVEMQEKKVIDFLANHFNRNVMKKRASGNRKRDSYRIDWQSQKAKDILVKLLPLLIGKKQQAEIGIQFQELVESSSTPGRKLTPEILSERDKFYVTMAQLKLNP